MNLVQRIVNLQEVIEYYRLQIHQVPQRTSQGFINSYAGCFVITDHRNAPLSSIIKSNPTRTHEIFFHSRLPFQYSIGITVDKDATLFASREDAEIGLRVLCEYLLKRDYS